MFYFCYVFPYIAIDLAETPSHRATETEDWVCHLRYRNGKISFKLSSIFIYVIEMVRLASNYRVISYTL